MSTAHSLDRTQRIGADGGIANHRPRRQIDRYSAGHIIVGAELIGRTVESATAIDEVIAAAALKNLDTREVVAALQRVSELGTANNIHSGEGVSADRDITRGGASC